MPKKKTLVVESYTEQRFRVADRTFTSRKAANKYVIQQKQRTAAEQAESFLFAFISGTTQGKKDAKAAADDRRGSCNEDIQNDIDDAMLDLLCDALGGDHPEEVVQIQQRLLNLLGRKKLDEFITVCAG